MSVVKRGRSAAPVLEKWGILVSYQPKGVLECKYCTCTSTVLRSPPFSASSYYETAHPRAF